MFYTIENDNLKAIKQALRQDSFAPVFRLVFCFFGAVKKRKSDLNQYLFSRLIDLKVPVLVIIYALIQTIVCFQAYFLLLQCNT